MYLWESIQIASTYEYNKTACSIHWRWKRKLEDYDIWYVLDGEGEIYINSVRHHVQAGTCCILRPGDEVEAYQNSNDRFTLIFYHFLLNDPCTGELIEDASSFLPPRVNFIKDQKNRYWLEQKLHALLEYSEIDGSYKEDLTSQLIRLILILLNHCQQQDILQPSHPHRHLMRKIMIHIQRNITRPINHQDLAKLVNLSPRYVSRLFKEYSGYSIKEYIKRTRLNQARTLLTETNKNVTQIAETLGYADIYFFSNQFKQQYGVSPINYRRQIRVANR